MAFVGSFIAPSLSRVGFVGAHVATRAAKTSVGRFTMQEKSPSVPFMDAPSNLNPKMPGYVGFGKFAVHSRILLTPHTLLHHGRAEKMAAVADTGRDRLLFFVSAVSNVRSVVHL